MTERDIQTALWHHLAFGYASSGWVVPNFHMDGWFEADVLALSKANLAWEIEVKISVADYKKDAEKTTERSHRGHGTRGLIPGVRKHDLLGTGCVTGPNRFSFAMPEEVWGKIDTDSVPEFAGVFVISHNWQRLVAREVRKPRLLHKGKVTDNTLQRARTAMYYRYWRLMEGIGRNAGPPDDAGLLVQMATEAAAGLRARNFVEGDPAYGHAADAFEAMVSNLIVAHENFDFEGGDGGDSRRDSGSLCDGGAAAADCQGVP